MKFGVIIPTRGDRPELLKNCMRILSQQTILPNRIIQVDYTPLSDTCDITARYREGYNYMRGQNLDVIFFIEDDDWYSPDYFETMLKAWQDHGKPDLFGMNHSLYYHLKHRAHFLMQHYQRSPAMATMIKPDLDINWPADSERYCDSHLWMVAPGLTKRLFASDSLICMGMKHGIGKYAGDHHNERMDRYANKDADLSFLKSVVDKESFDFYSNLFRAEIPIVPGSF